MPIFEKIETYSVAVGENDLGNTRIIRLKLETGGMGFIDFTEVLPADWLQFVPPPPVPATNLWMTADKFDEVYHLLQSEAPVFFTAINLAFVGRVGMVHTELDLSVGEPPGEGDEDADSLEAMIRLARKHPDKATF